MPIGTLTQNEKHFSSKLSYVALSIQGFVVGQALLASYNYGLVMTGWNSLSNPGLLYMCLCPVLIGFVSFRESSIEKKREIERQQLISQRETVFGNGNQNDPSVTTRSGPTASQGPTHRDQQDQMQELTENIRLRENKVAEDNWKKIECESLANRIVDIVNDLIENGSTGVRLPHILGVHLDRDIARYEKLADQYASDVSSSDKTMIVKGRTILKDRKDAIANKKLKTSSHPIKQLEID